MKNTTPETGQKGFPLYSVFLLMTVVACAFACIDLDMLRAFFSEEATATSSGSRRLNIAIPFAPMILGVCIGGFIGQRQRGGVRGFLGGVVFGAVSGLLVGVLVMMPSNPVMAVAAAAVLIGTSILFRWKTP